MKRSKKLFISGPVSCIPYKEAAIRFNEYALLAHQIGFEPVNPIRLCCPLWSWWRCMAVCLWHLLWCDAVLFLRGWDMSRGARIEHRVAEILGKVIMYEEE